MHADRTNRSVLILLGLLLTVAGVGMLLLHYGVWGQASASLLDNPVARFVGSSSAWFWPAAGVVALLIGLLALRWFLVLLLSTDRAGDLAVPGDRSAGTTTVSNSALSDAVTAQLESYPGVHSARARLTGDSEDPTLVLEVTLVEDGDLIATRRRIETELVAATRTAVDRPDLPVLLDLSVLAGRSSRVS